MAKRTAKRAASVSAETSPGPGRGGARAGAGRKPVADNMALLPPIRIDAGVKSQLEAIAEDAGEPLAALVRRVLEKEASRKR